MKRLLKMSVGGLIIAAVIAAVIAAIYSARRAYYRHTNMPPGYDYRHTNMPPGYELVINDEGRYAIKRPYSYIDRDYFSNVIGFTKQGAINRAWEQFEYEQEDEKISKSWRPLTNAP